VEEGARRGKTEREIERERERERKRERENTSYTVLLRGTSLYRAGPTTTAYHYS